MNLTTMWTINSCLMIAMIMMMMIMVVSHGIVGARSAAVSEASEAGW